MSTSQKIPFSRSINDFTDQRIIDALGQLGPVLPCHVTAVNGAIVTVNFDVNSSNVKFTFPPVTCATLGSRYIRNPVQVGDFGICVAADVRLGGITGLGNGPAPIVAPSNLGGLSFIPIGNVNWETIDPNAVVISAPNGAVIQTIDGVSSVIISENQINLNYDGNSVVINSSGITITGVLTINGVAYLSHKHTLVQTGTSESGPVGP